MTRLARVAAQGKINLWLHVGGPDGRGYHEISTLFQRVDLADDVTITALDDDSRRCTSDAPPARGADIGPPERNLAYRAAVAFQDRAGWPAGFHVNLTKRIPVGGGLGGGSADAGAVLRALNALCPTPLLPADLLAVAARVGSDVPFLASELVRAVGSGRGERLVPFEPHLPPADVLLLVPPFGVGTADAYRWMDDAGPRPPLARSSPATTAARSPWEAVDRGNDFEPVVEQRHPRLREMRKALARSGARIARLSGSGSTVFGIFPDGVQTPGAFGHDISIIRTRTSDDVVQVEVLE
ncbi:MAG TPA: 4-(cytidine 5'-diphospho)-2-C-methyl-D-erythritol kinase [Burkholderiales bacterium]|nr:4-(cytidine 5'-diphospho)-2-C-methyl-D-erythritol kinase [Burkholderiales bacterium]